MNKFNVGDVVCLKSEVHIKMTVTRVETDGRISVLFRPPYRNDFVSLKRPRDPLCFQLYVDPSAKS